MMTGVLIEADVRAAQAAVDALLEVLAGQVAGAYSPTPPVRLELRGVLAGFLADVRTAGYLEGVQRGRQEASHVVLDALKAEGLAP